MKIKLPIYKYNKNNLSYDKIKITIKNISFFLLSQLLVSLSIIFLISQLSNTPKEIRLKREITALKYEFYIIDKKINDVLCLLNTLEKKDSVIYQSLFNTQDTLNLFKSGYISNYNGQFSDTLVFIGDKLSVIEMNLERTNNRFRKLILEIGVNNERLNHIPAIQPISNNDLRRTSSGFGMRMHPIYNVRKFHHGMDFVAPVGTPIYATADGVVVISSKSFYGYGKYIKINHGYGYQTAYGHMNKLNVVNGQTIKRGDIIGYLGSTGLSTGPHLHYEVISNNKRVDPINYYFHDLSAEQYEEMLKISSSIEKSLD